MTKRSAGVFKNIEMGNPLGGSERSYNVGFADERRGLSQGTSNREEVDFP
jgi:hypothetical protein